MGKGSLCPHHLCVCQAHDGCSVHSMWNLKDKGKKEGEDLVGENCPGTDLHLPASTHLQNQLH